MVTMAHHGGGERRGLAAHSDRLGRLEPEAGVRQQL
jgi:hypothetical protein